MTEHEEQTFWAVTELWKQDHANGEASIREFRSGKLTIACGSAVVLLALSERKYELRDWFNKSIEGAPIREIFLVQGRGVAR